MKALEFVLGSFWHWAGFMVFLITVLYFSVNFFLRIIHKLIRKSTLKKLGYPPVHCDGDGDFRQIDLDD